MNEKKNCQNDTVLPCEIEKMKILNFRMLVGAVLFLSSISFLIYTMSKKSLMEASFNSGSYYILIVLFGFWLYCLCDVLKSEKISLVTTFKQERWAILLSLFLAIVVFISVAPKLRYFYDEPNLVLVSKSMHSERAIRYTTEAFSEDGILTPVKKAFPTRGLGFSFFVALIHNIVGYRVENVFIANFIFLFMFYFLILLIFRQQYGYIFSISLMLLITSHPIFTLTATSGLSDLSEIVLLLLSIYVLRSLLYHPTEGKFRFLLLTLVLLAYVRYESILFFAIISVLLLLLRQIKLRWFSRSFMYYLIPLLLLPAFWQKIITSPSFLSRFSNSGYTNIFTLENLLRHSWQFLQANMDFSFTYGYSNIANILGMIGLCYAAFNILMRVSKRQHHQRGHIPFGIIVGLCLIFKWLLITSYEHGEPLRFTASRFFIPYCIILSIYGIYFLHKINLFKTRPYAFLLISLFIFLIYHPIAILDKISKPLVYPRDYRMVMNFLTERSDNNSLVVTEKPRQYCMHNYGAVSINYANRNVGEILEMARMRQLSDIYVVQNIRLYSGNSSPSTRVSSRYKLKTLFERKNRNYYKLRISEVVVDKPAKLTERGSGIGTSWASSDLELKLQKIIKHPDINHPKSVLVSPDGKTAFVNNLYSHNTVLISTDSFKVMKTIPYDGRACEMTTSRKNGTLWVTLAALEGKDYPPYIPEPTPGWEKYDFPSVVLVVNPYNDGGEIIKRVPVQVKPKIVALSPDEKVALVSNFNSHTVSVIDTETYKVVKNIRVGKWPRGICFTSDGTYAYVANMGDNSISVINNENMSIVNTIKLKGVPRHIVRSPDGEYMYIGLSQREGGVLKLRVSDNKVIDSVKTGHTTRTIALSPNGQYLYCVNYAGQSISVVDTRIMSEVLEIPTKRKPIGLAVSQDGHRIWVVSFSDSCVLVYDVVYK